MKTISVTFTLLVQRTVEVIKEVLIDGTGDWDEEDLEKKENEAIAETAEKFPEFNVEVVDTE